MRAASGTRARAVSGCTAILQVDVEGGAGDGADVVQGRVAEQLGEDERTVPEPEDRELGDDDVGGAARRRADSVHSATTFGSPVDDVAVMVTITRRAPTTRSIAPPTPRTSFPGTAQFAMSPAIETCSAPSTATSTCPPRIIAKLCGAVEVRGAGERGDRLLRGVDEVGIELVLARPRPDAEEAVLRLQEDVGVVVEESGDEVRDADAEVDDLARPKLLRRAGRDRTS